jgi:hypothetical protein
MRWRFFGICFDNAGNYCNHVETPSRKSRRDRSSQLPCACRGLKLLLDQIFDTWIIWVKHICFDMKSFDYGGCSTGLGAGSDLWLCNTHRRSIWHQPQPQPRFTPS